MELLICVPSRRDVAAFKEVMRDAGYSAADASIHHPDWLSEHETGFADASNFVVRVPDASTVDKLFDETARSAGGSWVRPEYRVLDSREDRSYPA